MDLAILLRLSGDPPATRACLESLACTLPSSLTRETLLFDQSDLDSSSASPLRILPPLTSSNLAAARNAAVAASTAPLLCFLSPGTTLLRHWLPPMLTLLRHAPHAGCIGNVHREPYSGLIDHAGQRFDTAGLPASTGRNQALLPRESHDRHPTVSFACCLVTRELFTRLDGFDERFSGPLGDVDFCLRAAALGYRHYVANRSVVYHDARADAADPDPSAQAIDLALYETLWGHRARAAYSRRAALRHGLSTAPYSPEGWEMAREARRLQQSPARENRQVGFTYLRKHLHRPWRYNYTRFARALVQVMTPLPATLPLSPQESFHPHSDLLRSDDGWLFDPPLQ